MITLEQIKSKIMENDNFYILTHEYPDGDTFGSAFALCKALQKLGKKAKVLVDGDITDKFIYLTNGIIEQEFECNYVIAVDVAEINRLGVNKDIFENNIDIAIDHHLLHRPFAKEYYVDANSGANAQIIYKLINLLEIDIDSDIANCIFTGICTDTGCFKYANATAESFIIAAKMIECGADSANISREMFDTKSKRRVDIECRVLSDIEYFAQDKASMITVTRDMIEQTKATSDDTDGLASLPRQIQGVEIGVMIRERKIGGCKISVRTKGKYNATKICSYFGGGGHKAASGCVIEKPLEESKILIKEIVTKELNGEL